MSHTILVVDDEIGIRDSLRRILEKQGYAVLTAAGGEEAFRIIRQEEIHLLITDIRMTGMDGMELLQVTRSLSPQTEIIMITGYASVDTAVDSLKEGAFDYITKPFKKAEILRSVSRAIEHRTLAMHPDGKSGDAPLVEAASPAMRRVIELGRQVAPSQATVLILGASGTGKEVIADLIHHLSPRSRRPMIKVNCAALPETLIESELFGYEKGAFTGATARREGRFEAAHQSTIFLDEIAEVPPAVQVKLLRILQKGTLEHLGSNRTIAVDTRIIAATNRDLAAMVREGGFREDLFWRLNVISIELPPLSARREDIPGLVQHFLRRFAAKNAKHITGIESKAMSSLMSYAWPGNVRELENVMERSVVLDRDGIIDTTDLPREISKRETGAMDSVTIQLGTPLDEVEKVLMEQTLKYTRGDKTLAAKLLGVSTRTLYRRLERDDAL